MIKRKGIRWDYNGDGRFPTERIKGYWKKYWKKWLRREEKKKNPLTS
jgi:hypothetical protein